MRDGTLPSHPMQRVSFLTTTPVSLATIIVPLRCLYVGNKEGLFDPQKGFTSPASGTPALLSSGVLGHSLHLPAYIYAEFPLETPAPKGTYETRQASIFTRHRSCSMVNGDEVE